MCDVRESAKTSNIDKIAVMAALNMAHELLRAKSEIGFDSDDIRRRIVAMQVAIDQVMVEQDELF